MPAALVAILGFIASGLIWRILASIGFALVTASFIRAVANDYLNKSLMLMNTSLPPEVSALLAIARADDCISIIFGSITFVATYKSLKFFFVRK